MNPHNPNTPKIHNPYMNPEVFNQMMSMPSNVPSSNYVNPQHMMNYNFYSPVNI